MIENGLVMLQNYGSKAAAITARALDGDVASRAIIGCWIIR